METCLNISMHKVVTGNIFVNRKHNKPVMKGNCLKTKSKNKKDHHQKTKLMQFKTRLISFKTVQCSD